MKCSTDEAVLGPKQDTQKCVLSASTLLEGERNVKTPAESTTTAAIGLAENGGRPPQKNGQAAGRRAPEMPSCAKGPSLALK